MSPLRILIILALLVMVAFGQDEVAPAFAPEADEVDDYDDDAESPTIESPSYAPMSCPPSEAPAVSPTFSPAEGPDSSDDEAEAPDLDDDFDAAATSPLEDYSDDDADQTY